MSNESYPEQTQKMTPAEIAEAIGSIGRFGVAEPLVDLDTIDPTELNAKTDELWGK